MSYIKEYYSTKYIKLHFKLIFNEGTVLPVNKVSALRGGMGEMLLRLNCISGRKCSECEFEDECIVRRTMYSKMKINPPFMSEGDSVGYVLECENYHEIFREGEDLEFNLILFGNAIVYFSQYLQAFQLLGLNGIGKNHSKYVIKSIRNTTNDDLLVDNQIYMKNFRLHSIWDYIEYRKAKVSDRVRLLFQTPLTLKYRGEFLHCFDMEAIMNAIERRIYIFNCFTGIDCGRIDIDDFPVKVYEEVSRRTVQRFSSTQDKKIILKGITGIVDLEKINEVAKTLLIAGELIHIGKNSSFGFGKYTIIDSTKE